MKYRLKDYFLTMGISVFICTGFLFFIGLFLQVEEFNLFYIFIFVICQRIIQDLILYKFFKKITK